MQSINQRTKVEIMDTTLRDGEQTHNVSFTPLEKFNIATLLLDKVKVDRVEIASARVSEGELESVQAITKWARTKKYLNRIEILGFLDDGKSIDWIKQSGAKTINLLTKGSLKHLRKQLQTEPEEHFKNIENIYKYATQSNINMNVYLEDWSNGYTHDIGYVKEMIAFLTHIKVKRVLLPDTLGILYPTQVYQAISYLIKEFPKTHFEFHPHNDYGLAVANVLESIRAGVHGVHVTVNCLGERTGNAALAEVVAGMHDHLKIKTNLQEKELFNLSRMVETFSGKRIPSNKPIVGEDVFTQTAGIHADGDKKAKLYQSKLTPIRFNRKHAYALGKLSGKASLEQNLKELGIELSTQNKKILLEKIISLGDQKKVISKEDIPFLIPDILNVPLEKKVDLKNIVITSGKKVKPVCSMVIDYKDNESYISSSGDGGYDAFMNAIHIWAQQNKINVPPLIDYEVRIPPGGKTSALVETKITWKNTVLKNTSSLITRGVHPDQTIAAILATEKMLNMVL